MHYDNTSITHYEWNDNTRIVVITIQFYIINYNIFYKFKFKNIFYIYLVYINNMGNKNLTNTKEFNQSLFFD